MIIRSATNGTASPGRGDEALPGEQSDAVQAAQFYPTVWMDAIQRPRTAA
jgi:hypothetical protein